jgi:hypothetical protein
MSSRRFKLKGLFRITLYPCYQMPRTTTKRPPAKKDVRPVARASDKREPAVVRLSSSLKKRLKIKLAEDGRNFQDVAVELITRYVDGDLTHRTELEFASSSRARFHAKERCCIAAACEMKWPVKSMRSSSSMR